MYAIFEEVIGPQPLVSFPNTKGSHQHTEDEDQGIVVTTTDQNPEVNLDHSDVPSHYASSKSRPKHSPNKQQRIYGSSSYQNRHSSTLPRSNRRRLYSGSTNDTNDLDDTASISSSNPLLDTISVLAYDPPDDSDDYYDLNDDEYDQCKRDKNNKSTSGAPEGDRDSIGYAGSSSIDSGYKSFCPTPEIPDSSIYGTDASRQASSYSGYYADRSSQGRSGKPRIMMGTKVISRQGHVSPLRESPGSRRSDSSLYDVNLDHLMYLRQSLLSAIHKCEFSKSNSASGIDPGRTDSNHAIEKSLSSNPVNDERYLDDSPTKSSQPGYTKTVRFNTDVKVTTVNSAQPANKGSDVNPCRTSDAANAEQKMQSKSILKDPLCANLRSQLEAGSDDCTLEEEIDSLLYGRAEFYDLESVDDFPCSYVTMIEEKYRSGKTSIAKVRKLKGEKSQEQSSKSTPAVPETGAEPSSTTPEDDSRLQKPNKDSSAASATVSISKTAKCRFTEVARCMLEIIEDLQMKKLQPDSSKDSEAPLAESSSSAPDSNEEQKPSANDAGADSSSKSSNSECYASAAEYHVYEEIDYDFLTSTVPPLPKLQEVPPPLPVRPNLMVIKPDHRVPMQRRAPSPPPRKARCPLKRNPGPPADEGSTEVRNRPKQRGNLYCLFSDQVERRNISRSLEREWRVNGYSDNQEDDYGFKKEFPSI